MSTYSKVTAHTKIKELFLPNSVLEKALFTFFYQEGIQPAACNLENTLEEMAKASHLEDSSLLVSWMTRVQQVYSILTISPQMAHITLQNVPEQLLVDVRTPEEMAIASIPHSTPYDPAIEKLPYDTPIFFYCHHGVRSLRAAWRFVYLGFTHVQSIEGGIDLWASLIDPSIPLY